MVSMRARFNIRQTKALIWVACLGLFVWDGWTFFDIYQKKQKDAYKARSGEYYGQLMRDGAAEVEGVNTGPSLPARSQYETVWTALVNGEDPNPEPIETKGPETPKPTKTLKKIDDVLEISLVFWSSDPATRFVAIEYKEAATGAAALGKARRLHVSEGEQLRPPYDADPYNARVLEIRPQQVVIQWGEDEEVIDPGLGRDGKGVPNTDWDPSVKSDPFEDYEKPPAESVYLEEGEWLLGTADKEQVARDPHAFLQDQVRVRTIAPKTGQRSMLELTHVEEGSVAYRLGARTNDRIISVNGIPMTSTSAAVNWFKANPDEGTYVVRYERSGAEKTITFHTK